MGIQVGDDECPRKGVWDGTALGMAGLRLLLTSAALLVLVQCVQANATSEQRPSRSRGTAFTVVDSNRIGVYSLLLFSNADVHGDLDREAPRRVRRVGEVRLLSGLVRFLHRL